MLSTIICEIPNEDAILEMLRRFAKLLNKYARLLNYEDAYNGLMVFFLESLLSDNMKKLIGKPDAVIVHYIIETLIPVSVFCYLRSKIGGYHAKQASICLLLSSLFVISCKLSVNALIEINPYIFWNSNLVVMSIGYILRPVYPSEAAVPVEDAEKNNISKKLLLALILLVQVLAELIKIRIISVCLFYGVIMAITSVIILKKEGRKNETH